ncbi:ArpU family phage packaging/lysis transcriptional regulator [Nicoliella lavandulae]|uniref:ArpU family phage packaging/lysis transcriptional regulator n=1 Tax=Nicoliella lavandulae TaxID=3082954 RepID=A0ABU8SN78_9LACO
MQTSFFSRVDKAKSINRAETMLRDYQNYRQLSRRPQIQTLQSPTISDMPTGHAYGNTNEDKIIKYLSRQEEAKMYCMVCTRTIEAIESDVYKSILTDLYIRPIKPNSVIWDKMGYSESRFYDLRKESLLVYSEVCPGIPTFDDDGVLKYEELLVYRK